MGIISEDTEKTLFSPFSLAVMLLIVFGLILILFSPKSSYLKVNFFDVGQGDAALISTPNNQYVLIDGGPNSTVVPKLSKTVPIYHHTIDAVILSHPHADHLDGLLDVIKKYEIKNIYATGVLHTTPEYIEFLNLIKEKSIPLKVVKSGDSLDLGDETKILFLFPLENLAGTKPENLNDSSIVAKLKYGEKEVLFMGDLEAESQTKLLSSNQDVRADLLKVPHHGSVDSLNQDFISRVAPKFAVISVGKDNKFGHPSQTVLAALRGVTIFRTDQDGDVVFNMTKQKIWLNK